MSDVVISAQGVSVYLDAGLTAEWNLPQIEHPDGTSVPQHSVVVLCVPYAYGAIMYGAAGIVETLRYEFDQIATASSQLYDAARQRPIAIPAGAKFLSVYEVDAIGQTITPQYGVVK